MKDQTERYRAEGLRHALEATLELLGDAYGDDARPRLEFIRDRLVRQLENSTVPPNFDHAEVTGQAIDAVTRAFIKVLADLPTDPSTPTRPAPTLRLVKG